jgi:hypothetical protein
MNTRSRIKNVLILAVVLGIFGVFVGSLQAVVLVYEPFDYTAGTILTGSGGTGFDGAWSTTGNDASTFLFTIRDGGLTFTDSGSIPLKVAGNSVYRPGSTGRTEANRALSAFSQGALFSDGSTIWFSVLYNKTADTGNYFGFVIGTDTFDVASTGALSGYATGGEGFGVGSNYGDKVEAISYDDASGMAAVNSGLVADPVRLIAGKIVWNANGTADELYLYNVTDLLTEPTTPIATITADLDQSNFDRVAIMHNVSNALFDEIRIGTTYSDVVGFSHPMDPCPYDGETVSAGDVELSWKNLPSNADPNGYVWVDVWFGTDPNDFGTPEGPKVLDKEQDATSVIVNAPIAGTPPTTYYWQVDSYLEGSPAGDPNVGDVWIFFASDLPPSVDAGVDMITWSGEAVQLSPSIEDDGHSAVS